MFAQLLGLKTVSPDRLHQLMQTSPSPVIVDVNAPQSWLANRIPGAIHLDPLAYAESDLPRDKEAMIVFYCSNYLCRKAPNAARRARQMGYENVHVLPAGITGWLKAKLPTQQG